MRYIEPMHTMLFVPAFWCKLQSPQTTLSANDSPNTSERYLQNKMRHTLGVPCFTSVYGFFFFLQCLHPITAVWRGMASDRPRIPVRTLACLLLRFIILWFRVIIVMIIKKWFQSCGETGKRKMGKPITCLLRHSTQHLRCTVGLRMVDCEKTRTLHRNRMNERITPCAPSSMPFFFLLFSTRKSPLF